MKTKLIFLTIIFLIANVTLSFGIIEMSQVASFSNITTMNYSTSIDIEGDYAYITGYNSASLVIINLSNKLNPKQVGYFTNKSSLDGAWYVDADPKGEYAYVGGDGPSEYHTGLVIINIKNKSNPYQVSALAEDMDDIYSLKISNNGYGNLIYLTSQEQGYLYIINVTDKINPAKVSNISVYKARMVLVDDSQNYAFVGTNNNSNPDIDINNVSGELYIINITDKNNPQYKSKITHPTLTDVQAGYIEGDYLYTSAWHRDDLTIINITDKSDPYIQTIFKHPRIYGSMDLRVHNNLVYMTSEYANSIVIVDVKNPNNPQLIGHFCNVTSLYYPYELEIIGDYIYIASKYSSSYTLLKTFESEESLPVYNDSRCYNQRPTDNRMGESISNFNASLYLQTYNLQSINHSLFTNNSLNNNWLMRFLNKLKFW